MAGSGGGGYQTQVAADPTLTPKNDAERAAVKDALDALRKKSQNGGNGATYVSTGPTQNTAEINVHLPADARLFVDNVPCPLTSAKRTFNTPQLEQGKKYFYNLRAEVVRNGQTQSETVRVLLTPGQQVRVEFTKLMPTRVVQR